MVTFLIEQTDRMFQSTDLSLLCRTNGIRPIDFRLNDVVSYNTGPRRTRLAFTDDDMRSGVEELFDGLETDPAIPARDDNVASGLVGKIWNRRRINLGWFSSLA
jgi:hypothetical protein